MSEFRIVVFNTIQEGFSRDQVLENLARYLKIDITKTEKLLQRPETVIKKSISSENIKKFELVLDRCGIGYEIQPLSAEKSDESVNTEKLDSENDSTLTSQSEIDWHNHKPRKPRLINRIIGLVAMTFGGYLVISWYVYFSAMAKGAIPYQSGRTTEAMIGVFVFIIGVVCFFKKSKADNQDNA